MQVLVPECLPNNVAVQHSLLWLESLHRGPVLPVLHNNWQGLPDHQRTLLELLRQLRILDAICAEQQLVLEPNICALQ